jgi:putative Mg2+ transporter-C (MgtC) family protein
VRRATIVPGEGTSAVLRVELGRSLSPEQVTALIRRLLTLKSVEQVEQIAVDRDPEDESSQDGRLPALRQRGAPSALNLHDDTLLQDLDGADRPERGNGGP